VKISQIVTEAGFMQGFKQGFNNPVDTIKQLATTTSPDFLSKDVGQAAAKLKDTQNIVPLKIIDQLNQLDSQQRVNLYNSIIKNQVQRKDLLSNSILQAGEDVKNRVLELIKPR